MAEGMKIMIQYTCCFSGHRSIEEIHLKSLKDNLQNEIISLIQQKMQYFICGGALGFDTLAAQTVIALKKLYSHIHLTLMLPCRDQDKYWKKCDQQVYQAILDQADKIRYISEYYYRGCMHKRNKLLVDSSCYCVCYLTKEKGGTAFTVNYARKKGLNIINLADRLP